MIGAMNLNVDVNLKDRVSELAEERGITSIALLERKAGLSNGSIRHWNESLPSVDKLMAVANVLGVSVGYILGEEISNEEIEERDRLREELFRNPEYRGLMDMASKCTPDELRTLMEMMKTWKRQY